MILNIEELFNNHLLSDELIISLAPQLNWLKRRQTICSTQQINFSFFKKNPSLMDRDSLFYNPKTDPNILIEYSNKLPREIKLLAKNHQIFL